ncbi:hypothetical protein UFOVP1196_28 [uncultured Caudovirales phage]|uniref:Uncharacterized protein n=1 Tax=uncultured Caudovirales phage TaxID=2100421 RepID=A0A6J5R961_9CAUD|nr:hypothetical protein UFOVP1196_28 [uncultured Caudovirales phage]
MIMKPGTVSRAIEAYTERTVKTLECHPDPKVPGTYAFRATMAEGDVMGFLTIGVPLQKVTDEDLEEIEIDTWPPVSGPTTTWVLA